MSEVEACYRGSDGFRTTALFDLLKREGPRGLLAVNLFRACKNSERAKGYRRGRSVRAAYSTKDWAIGELVGVLVKNPSLGVAWGWGRDEAAINFENVLYVEVPGEGQVSFHTGYRGAGPDYGKPWDGAKGTAPERIIRYANTVLGIENPPRKESEDAPRQDRAEGAAPAGAAEHEPGDAAGGQGTFGF